ncbi:MAG: glycosyltransferase family 9 protein [Bryobacterales bacterium]|nr:glycosyltransferase family 9 protein [Bryobacterales bacterium]
MGDIVHTLPAVATLKHSFPASHLTWIVAQRWAPLLEGNPFVDAVIPFDRKSLTGLAAAWRGLRAGRFDLAIDFQGLIQSAALAGVARADRIFGYHRSSAREPLACAVYSNTVTPVSRHIVDQHLDLARAAGAGSVVKTFPLPMGTAEDPLPRGPFVLGNPLAGWESKQWPLAAWSELAGRLYRETGMPLVVNGPPGALEVLREIRDAQIHLSPVAGLIAATRRATAVVGTDSGPLHLAAALERPGVALFGPTDPERNGPYGGRMHILRAPGAVTSYKRLNVVDPSMRAITPDQVFEALQQQMRPSSTPSDADISQTLR